jgi:hypothetical protein
MACSSFPTAAFRQFEVQDAAASEKGSRKGALFQRLAGFILNLLASIISLPTTVTCAT